MGGARRGGAVQAHGREGTHLRPGGEDGKVEADEPGVGDTISSLVLVTPWRWWGGLATYLLNLVEDLRCNSQVNSSLILLQISELNQ